MKIIPLDHISWACQDSSPSVKTSYIPYRSNQIYVEPNSKAFSSHYGEGYLQRVRYVGVSA